MDYDLKGEIRLKSTDDSQQSWCLQEFNNEGEQVGEDLEPHGGHANFTASNLSVSYQAGVSHFTLMGEEKESKLNEYETIRGNLKPKVDRTGNSQTFSLFRTDLTIQHFAFHIGKLADDADRHVCFLLGYPSHAYDWELGLDADAGGWELGIGLLPASYDKLFAEIKSNRVDELNVELNYVPGFYSVPGGWTFSDDIKVLLRDDKPEVHQVILPDDCEIDPPRLGEVKEFDITINQSRTLNLAQGVSETKQSVSKEEIETARWEQLLSDNKESNRFLHEGLNRIIMLLGLLIGMVFILVSIYGFLLIYKQEIPYLGWIGFVILVITCGAFFILFNHLPGKGWGKTETLGPVWSDAEKEQMEQESKWIFEQARLERKREWLEKGLPEKDHEDEY